jgi:predicted NBD/HSP70 family sugar kinase
MYLGVDIGGSKTLVAVLNDAGIIQEQRKFLTPTHYSQFLLELADTLKALDSKTFRAGGVGAPGNLDREYGVGHTFGNLPWHDVPIQADIKHLTHCPIVVENDANLAGLSEAMLLPDFKRVLYITVSTGIGTGIIFDQKISPAFADSEGGQMLLEYRGKLKTWETFASGRAIAERYGKKAKEITDDATWQTISRQLAVGFIELIAVVQPDVIVIGGSIGTYFDRYEKFLLAGLRKYETPLLPIPPIRQASRPEQAVVYGCYDLAKQLYGSTS